MERKWLRSSDWLYSPFFLPIALFALTIAMFAGGLLSAGDQILSSGSTDLSGEFVYWRQFGFEQLRAGHLALWDPHVFSGVPFMGNFQSALFYPPNWIYLVLPLHSAINSEIVLHVFLLGLCTAAWLKRYEFHPLALLLACTVSMFGAPFFLHIYAGHLATLDAMAWIPLVLLSLEELLEEPRIGWILVGIFAFSMQFLAGYPQTFFSTLVSCALYVALRLWSASYRKQTILAIAIVGVAAVAITAVQLWTGLDAASEGTRRGGVPFSFAIMFSFPPENFLTALVPGLFGNMSQLPYWGRCYLWEMSAFFGVTGLVMAIFGTTVKFPHRAVCLLMVLLISILALGNHTPLFALLYRFVPGFDHFRSHSKFFVQATPFIAVLTGQGMNQVLRSPRGTRLGAMLVFAAALILAAIGFFLWRADSFPAISETWHQLMDAIEATSESYLPSANYGDPDFVANAASFAGLQCLLSAAILIAIGLMLYLRSSYEKAAIALAIFGVGEIFLFTNSLVATFSLADTLPTQVKTYLADHPGDYRVLELPAAPDTNGAIAIGADDIWGYDPMVLGRYAQFVTYSQGGDPDQADMYVNFSGTSRMRMLRLVRLKYIFRDQVPISDRGEALPHLLLLSEWAKLSDRDEVLSSLASSAFDPARTAILETAPEPSPVAGDQSPGTVQLLRSDSNSLTISARLTRPSLLLVTDCYSRFWRAVAQRGSAQNSYKVIPADYTLMAVPLGAGDHLFRLEYAPPGYIIGRWVSLAGLILYIFAVGFFLARRPGRLPLAGAAGKAEPPNPDAA